MDRSTHVTLAGVLVGIVVGVPGGILFEVARNAWRGHGAAKKATEAAGRSARRRTAEFVLLGFFLLAAAAWMVGRANDH